MFKRWLLIVLELCGFNRLLAFHNRRRIIILRYHRVVDNVPRAIQGLRRRAIGDPTSEAFRFQLEVITSRYKIISLGEALDMIEGRRPVDPYSVVLTFDDGYRNNLTHAYPVLRSFHASATIFVVSSFVEHRKPLWFNRLDSSLQAAAGPLVLNIDGAKRTFALGSVSERWEARQELARLCKLGGVYWTENLLNQVEKRSCNSPMDESDDDWTAPATWADLKAAWGDGIDVGCHTANHEMLGRVERSVVVSELTSAKRVIEARLGRACDHFCYPYGGQDAFNNLTREEVIRAGFKCACTTVDGFVKPGDDVFELRRRLLPSGPDRFAILAALSGVWPAILRLRDRLLRRE